MTDFSKNQDFISKIQSWDDTEIERQLDELNRLLIKLKIELFAELQNFPISRFMYESRKLLNKLKAGVFA